MEETPPKPVRGRPKKTDEDKIKRSTVKFLVRNADRLRNFILVNRFDSLDDGLVKLLNFYEENNATRPSSISRPVSCPPFSSTPSAKGGSWTRKATTKMPVSPVEEREFMYESDEDDLDETNKFLLLETSTAIDADETFEERDLAGFSSTDSEDEESICYETPKKPSTKIKPISKKGQEVLKNLAKCSDLDYSNSRRLLEDNYQTAFSLHATKQIENVLQRRFIVDEDALWLLLGNKCKNVDCQEKLLEDCCEYQVVGCVYIMTWTCSIGHSGVWRSSERLTHMTNKKSQFYVTNVLFASSCLFTGNLWSKLALFCKALNLQCVSESLYYKVQRNLAIPVINNCFVIAQKKMFDKAKQLQTNLMICGDCQNDSPGNTAEFGVYTFVDHECGYVLDMEVVEKRYTDLKSPNMEKTGFIRSICRLFNEELPIAEIVTDQNIQLIAIFSKTDKKNLLMMTHRGKIFVERAQKGDRVVINDAKNSLAKYPDFDTVPLHQLSKLKNVCHQLDIWHKAKNIGKAIVEASNKGAKDEKAERKIMISWVPDLKNHFWYCSQKCGGDVEKMIEMWMNSLKHITGVHEWALGECKHAPGYVQINEAMNPDSKTFKNLRSSVIGSPKLLDSFHYFRNFRHTGQLECFHNLSLAYTPKRIVFDFDTMIARKHLAAIDNNHHVHRKIIRDDGVPRFTKRWSKRSDDWIIQFTKERKNYSYLPHMQAAVLQLRMILPSINLYPTEKNELHPSRIAPNTGKFQKSLSDLLEKYETRYK